MTTKENTMIHHEQAPNPKLPFSCALAPPGETGSQVYLYCRVAAVDAACVHPRPRLTRKGCPDEVT